MTNEISVVFCNGSNYDYHFIVKELAKEFECLGEKKKSTILFMFQYKRKLQKSIKISCKIKFVDSARLMTSSLSNLVNNFL